MVEQEQSSGFLGLLLGTVKVELDGNGVGLVSEGGRRLDGGFYRSLKEVNHLSRLPLRVYPDVLAL